MVKTKRKNIIDKKPNNPKSLKAIAQGKKQALIMKEILKDPSIHEIWDSEEIEHKILSKL